MKQQLNTEEQKGGSENTDGEKFLYQLNKVLYKFNMSKLDHELVAKLGQFSQKILEKRRKGKGYQPSRPVPKKEAAQAKLTSSPSEIIEEYDESMESSIRRSIQMKRSGKIKPSHLKNMGAVFVSPFLVKNLLPMLAVGDLLRARLVSKEFALACDTYFPFALQREADIIYKELEREGELNATYMEIVQTQIPIATNEWLKLELSEVLESALTKQDITSLKSIKRMPPEKDLMFAPFCILYHLEPTRLPGTDPSGQLRLVSWHTSALRTLQLPNFLTLHAAFDRDCLEESVVLEAFEYLNKDELQVDRATSFNAALGNLVRWCQSTVAYHIITHPYKVRNLKTVQPGSKLYEFAVGIDQKMGRFYAFKSFLLKANKISRKTNFAFNLKHSRVPQKTSKTTIYSLGPAPLELIFQFLAPKEALSAKLVTKRWTDSINEHWEARLIKLATNIESIKIANIKKLITKLPALYEYGFFLNALQMLDSILYSEQLFFSRTHLEDIKCIKKFSAPMQHLFNAFLTLLDYRPIRKQKPNGDVELDYYSQVRELLIKKKAVEQMNRLDKYAIPHKTLQQVEEVLTDPENNLSLRSVKAVNQGLYQLLLWIKAILTLNKMVNPLLFISADYVRKRLAPDEVELVEYIYQSIESWKVMYTIRLRSTGGKSCLSRIVSEAKKNLGPEAEEYLHLGRWEEGNRICLFYFNAKDQVPVGAHPALVEKALSEFFGCFKDVETLGFESLHFTMTNQAAGSSLSEVNSNNQSLGTTEVIRSIKAGKKGINIDATLLDHKILSGSLMFYLDTNEILACSLVNKHWNKGVKMHMILRAIKIIEEAKTFQESNKEIAEHISAKRKQYYEDYEIPPPTKESALRRMGFLEAKDLTNLRAVKRATEGYEFYVAPFVILMGQKPEVKRFANNTKEISYWRSAQRIWAELNLYQKIREFPMELIAAGTFKKMQEFVGKPQYTAEEAGKLSPSLGNFVSWILGVCEFHQYLRKYCEREMDGEILDEAELRFLHEMDTMMYHNFKIFKFVAEKCAEYKEVPFIAQELSSHPQFKLDI